MSFNQLGILATCLIVNSHKLFLKEIWEVESAEVLKAWEICYLGLKDWTGKWTAFENTKPVEAESWQNCKLCNSKLEKLVFGETASWQKG